MFKWIITSLILSSMAPLGATEFMDSLILVLDKLPGKEAQCDRLSDVAFIVINEAPELAKECANKLKDIASTIGYKEGEAYATYHFGNINYYLDEFDEGAENLEKAFSQFEKIGDEYGMGLSLNTLGEMLTNSGNYGRALGYLFKALEHMDNAGSPEGRAWVNNNIGRIHRYQANYDEALTYFNEALKTADDIRSGDAWLYITFTYIQMNRFAEAQESVEKALELAKRNNDQYVLSDSYFCLGQIEAFYGKYEAALEHLIWARNMKLDLEDNGWTEISNHIASIYLSIKNPETAKKHYLEALITARETGLKPEYREASLGLSNVFNAMGAYDSAYHYLALHNQLEKDLRGEEASKKLAELEASLAAAQREQEIENERKLAAAREEAEKKEKQLMLIGGAIIIVMLIVFSGFMVNRFRMKQKANRQLEAFNKEIMHQRDIIEEKNKDIMDSIKYAKRIQGAILPPQKLVKEYLPESFILYKPKDVVAGDFYWMEHTQGKVLFAAADCTGHGVPGAMVSVVCKNGLNRSVREHGLTDPGKILDKTREIVISEFEKSEDEVKDGMDISLCALQGNTLHWAGANNPLWTVRSKDIPDTDPESKRSNTQIPDQVGNVNYELIDHKPNKQPIGKYADPKPFATHSIELQKGDTLYIFTDGFQDQFGGPKGKKFKPANFKKLLLSIQQEPMEKQRQLIDEAFESWRGELEQIDDVCIIGVRL